MWGDIIFKFDGHFTACGHLAQTGAMTAALGAEAIGTNRLHPKVTDDGDAKLNPACLFGP